MSIFLDFSDHKIVLNRLFKDRFSLLNRQRLKIEGPIGKRTVLNEILLNRSTVNVPEFQFSMNDDDKFFFPSAIVKQSDCGGFYLIILSF